jgi:hypothetical protein
VSASRWIPAPLAEHDPARARALNARVRDQISDVRRHLAALRTAMADFGEDFDPDVFAGAHDGEDPIQLNRVKAVERGVEQLYGFVEQLAASGLELAGLRGRRDQIDTASDLDLLVGAGVLRKRLAGRLKRLCELQRMRARDHASAEHVHESALILAGSLPAFYDAYGAWVKRGFSP